MSRIADIALPDSSLAREALEMARELSTPMLFNHVMRSCYFAELFARGAPGGADRELMMLSAVLHDLGLTGHFPDTGRFEIVGADAARTFLEARGVEAARAWRVWDIIALHPFDVNLYRQAEARFVQMGILADVVGLGVDALPREAVADVLGRYPRLGFKRGFFELLRQDTLGKPPAHVFHPSTMIAHHCCAHVDIPDARQLIEAAPFDE